LQTGLDHTPLLESLPDVPPITHANIRGAGYYQQGGETC